MCHRTTSLICPISTPEAGAYQSLCPLLEGQQFSRVRVIAVRAVWSSGRHSDCEGSEM
jgi:hypothetical protein